VLPVVEEHRAKAEGWTIRPKDMKGTRITMPSKAFYMKGSDLEGD
jgi:hypothetical protein